MSVREVVGSRSTSLSISLTHPPELIAELLVKAFTSWKVTCGEVTGVSDGASVQTQPVHQFTAQTQI